MAEQQNNEATQEQTQHTQTGQPQPASQGDNEKVVSAVAYLGILFFVPLLTNPESDFAKYHANQGLLLLITAVVVGTLSVIPIIGWFIIGPLGMIFLIVLFIMGIVHAVNGEKKPLPLIGGFELIK